MCHLSSTPPHPSVRKNHVAKPTPHPHHHHPPPPTHIEAIQSVRVIRASNSPRTSTSRLHHKRQSQSYSHSHSDENGSTHAHSDARRVHFTPPPAHRVTHIRDIPPYPATAVRHRITPHPPIHLPPPLPFPPHSHPRQQQQIPTIYILTFATDSYPNTPSSLSRLLASQLPAHTHHLYTLDLRALPPPPSSLCAVYSGISPVLQDAVLASPVARKLVGGAVGDLLSYIDDTHANGKIRGGARGGMGIGREVSMSVCCHAGTHRSVAVGERIAQGVKAEVGRRGGGDGVRVVVRHVSRVRGVGDPF